MNRTGVHVHAEHPCRVIRGAPSLCRRAVTGTLALSRSYNGVNARALAWRRVVAGGSQHPILAIG